jgi:hypothetical protein
MIIKYCISLVMLMSLQACAVYSVASSAVSITADVVSTGVHVVTGAVDTVVDVVTPSKKK